MIPSITAFTRPQLTAPQSLRIRLGLGLTSELGPELGLRLGLGSASPTISVFLFFWYKRESANVK